MRTPTHQRPFILGVAGGTGSGKTTVSRRIHEALGGSHIAYLQHDSYYYDHSHMSPEERAAYNYDHPDSLDTDLLISHVHALLKWQPDRRTRLRLRKPCATGGNNPGQPASIILLEGILIFVEPRLRRRWTYVSMSTPTPISASSAASIVTSASAGARSNPWSTST